MKYLKHVFGTVKKSSPILYGIVLIHLALATACFIGFWVDDRMLMGLNVWVKPFKFSISGGIYILTVGYLITLYPYGKIKKNIINNLTSFTLLFEIGIIVFQASRGVQSHYNQSSLFDGLLFAAMGLLIGVNVLLMLLFIIDTIRLRLKTERAIQWAIVMGWTIVFFGSWVGGQMIGQMAHNVGVTDGGEGLPLLNWSTIAGDLRVAHFFGLHAIQIVPLFAFLISKKTTITYKQKHIAVCIFGLLYAVWIGFTFYQAKQGIALIQF
ncbi:hypothetical protein [Costertonia aggregata]|uniref:Uncharacterized protein n=1 Tax=Costertonia aggregata TaxID=343403 RepID=A0A7H9ATV1_9FLAO|nr:hypothetical protein [Costertonia aggregata]QLG46898.1 hypothetical protein HYG79_16570 [Costertonia aggregata]